MIKTIDIADIDRGGRLRPVSPVWARTMAERIEAGDRLPPVEVVERADGRYRLVAGGHRTEAHVLAGRTEIEAVVLPAADYPSEAAIRLREIRENIVRYELTALDRAVHLAAWKQAHEEIHGRAKPGRKSRQNSAAIPTDADEDPHAAFAGTFSAAAAEALKISERSVRVAVQVATGITAEVRGMIALAPIADVMAELIHLSQQEAGRQVRIAKLILDRQAGSVADAIAMLDRIPRPERLKGWEKVSEGFARLPEAQRHAFFDAHADAIDAWRAARMTAKG